MKGIEQVLVFRVGSDLYSIDSSNVDQILRVPELTNVPMSMNMVRGIASIKGAMVSIIDLYNLIYKDNFIDLKSLKARIITVNHNSTIMALLVDDIQSNVILNNNNVQHSSNNDIITEVITIGDNLVHFLSVDKLSIKLEEHKYSSRDFSLSEKVTKKVDISTKTSRNYFVFTMGDEKFAIETDIIREIIASLDISTNIPNANEHTLGLITLREEVLVAIDFRKYFNITGIDSKDNRLIIINHLNNSIALLVDSVIDIKDFSDSEIQDIPSKFKDRHIVGVIEIADDELISIVDKKEVIHLLNNSQEDDVNEDNDNIVEEEKISDEDLVELVIFNLGNEEYALDIESVEEIINVIDITSVMGTNELLEGIINLRGGIIPVISLHQRLGIKKLYSEDQKILINRVNGLRVGFIVDEITEISSINKKDLKASDSEDKLFSDIVILEEGNRIILKMESAELFNSLDLLNFD
jgi:purine-binding chemotaxis protein CheW